MANSSFLTDDYPNLPVSFLQTSDPVTVSIN